MASKNALPFSDDGTKYRGPYQAVCGCVWSGNGSTVAPFKWEKCALHGATQDLMAAVRAFLFQVIQGKVLERDAVVTQARAAYIKAGGKN